MAGGDIKQRLAPGQEMPISVSGDYIFLKFADRDISVVITDGEGAQKPVVMAVGDKYRPGPFKQFLVRNTDDKRPAQIIMTVGQGDYNRQILAGEISVTPGVTRSDGTRAADSRKILEFEVWPELDVSGGGAVRGRVVSNGLKRALYRPDPELPTTADLIMKEGWGEGAVVSGQIIKACLEWYYRRELVGEYMDSVFGFWGPKNDLTGGSLPPVWGGAYTLAWAEYEDDFEVILPSKVRIEIDNSLQLGRSLWEIV